MRIDVSERTFQDPRGGRAGILSTCLPNLFRVQIGDNEDDDGDDERRRQLRGRLAPTLSPLLLYVRTENAPRREFRYDGNCDVLRRRRHVTKMKHLGSVLHLDRALLEA